MHQRTAVLAAMAATVAAPTGCAGTAPAASEPATSTADTDGDGVPDAADAGPAEAGTRNGRDNEDGGPDCGELLILVDWEPPVVSFEGGTDALRPDDAATLDAVATAMQANAAVDQVACVGTADPEEPDPERLAAHRARAVLDALVARGVAPERLVAWSEVKPAPSAAGHGGRVRFLLVRANGVAIRRPVEGGWEMADELGPPPEDGYPSCRLGTANWIGCDGVPFHATLPREAECCDEAACRAGCEAGRAAACRALGLLRWTDVLDRERTGAREAFRRACTLGDETACGLLAPQGGSSEETPAP